MRRHFGRNLFLLMLGLLALLMAGLRTEWAGEQACELGRKRLPALLGMDVALGRCSLDPLRGGIEVVGVGLVPPGATEPMFAADRVLVRLSAVDVLTGRVRLERVELERPRVQLDLTKPAKEKPGTKKAHRASRKCFLDDLSRVEVHNLSVTGAELGIVAPQGRSLHLDDLDVDLRLSSRAYTARLSVPRGEIDTGDLALPLSRLRLSSTLDLDEQRLLVNHLEVAAGDFSVFSRGGVDSLCEPSPSLETSLYVPLDLVTAVLGPKAPKMSGSAAVVLRVEGDLRDPTVDAEVTLARAQIEQYEIGDAYLEARLAHDEVRLVKLNLPVGEGTLKVSGTLGLAAPMPIVARAQLEDVEFAPVLDKLGIDHAWVDFLASGPVEVRGQVMPFHLSGPADLAVRRFRLYDRGYDRPEAKETLLQFDEAGVELQADFNAERVRLSNAHIVSEKSRVLADATLHYESARGLDVSAELGELDLSDLKHLLGIPIDGRIAGKATLRGPYSRPVIDATVTGQAFKFHLLNLGAVEATLQFRDDVLSFPSVVVNKGRSRFLADGALDFRFPDLGPVGRGRGSFENARLSDLVEAVGDEHWIFDLVRKRMEARINGSATVEGPVAAPRADIRVDLADTTYFDRKLGAGAFRFRAQDAEFIAIDRLDFQGPCGEVSFSGQLDFEKGMEFRIEAPRLFASELGKPDAEFLRADGTLSVKARLFGPPDHTQMEGTVRAEKMGAFGVPLGSGTLALALDNTDLSLKGPLGGDLLLDMRMVIEGEMPFAVGVSADIGDLGRYAVALPGLRGSLAGELFATGTIDRYLETQGDLWISQLSVGKGDYLARSEGPIELGFQGSAVELRALSLKGPTGTRLAASGIKDADGALDLSLQGAFDVKLVESFTPWIEQSGGEVQLSATVAGTSEKPAIIGSGEVRNGRFSVHGWPVTAKDLHGRLEFSQSKVVVAAVDGTVNGGRARVSGDVELKNFVPHRLDLGLLADGVAMRIPASMPSTVSGELRLYGLLDDLVLTGDVDMERMRYTQDLDLEAMVKDLRRRRLEARSFEKIDEFVRYDVAINVKPDARIDNNLVKTTLQGKLHLVGNNAHMGMLGTLTSVGGGRAYFRGTELSLTRVSVELTERDRIEMVLDAHAETQVRDYRVFLHAYGPLDDPQVELSSEPELERADVLTLLTLGVTSRETNAYTAGTGASLVAETMLNLSGLDKTVKRFIPQNKILRDFNFQISTGYSEVSGAVEPMAHLESRFLTDSLKLRLMQPVSTGRGRKMEIEYRFNEHLSSQFQWDNNNSNINQPFGDLGADLKWRWELE